LSRVFLVLAAVGVTAQLALMAGTVRAIRVHDLGALTDPEAGHRALAPFLSAARVGDISMFAAIMLFAVFLNRATHAVRALGGLDLRYGPRWALFGWLVPIWGLFVPKRVVDDLWRASVPVERTWSGIQPRAPRGSMAVFVSLYVANLILRVASGSTQDAAPRLLAASSMLFASLLAGLVYVAGLTLRLDARARSLGLDAGPPAPFPRPVRFAKPLAAAAGLICLTGTVLGSSQMVALPAGLVQAASPDMVAGSATALGGGRPPSAPTPPPAPFLLRTALFTVSLANKPVVESDSVKLGGVNATVTDYRVNTDTAVQGLRVITLPPGTFFAQTPKELLTAFADDMSYSLPTVTNGTIGQYAYAQAHNTGAGGNIGLRMLVHSGTEVLIWSDGDSFPALVGSLRMR
jgi:hypothetical protein